MAMWTDRQQQWQAPADQSWKGGKRPSSFDGESLGKRPKAPLPMPPGRRVKEEIADDDLAGGEMNMEEEWPAAASAVKGGRAPVSGPQALTKDSVEIGMVVSFDRTRRGWVDNCFSDLNEFWIRSESDGDLVRKVDEAGNSSPQADIRTFSSSELIWTGGWSREVPATTTINVPEDKALRRFLLSSEGEQRLHQLSEKLGALLSVDADDSAPGRGIIGPFCIIVGPGFTPEVKAAAALLSEELLNPKNFTNPVVGLQSQAISRSAPVDVPLGAPVPSWMNHDGTDRELQLDVGRSGELIPVPPQMHFEDAEEYRKGYEAAMKQIMEEEDESSAEEDNDDDDDVDGPVNAIADAEKVPEEAKPPITDGSAAGDDASKGEGKTEETTLAVSTGGEKKTVLDWAVDQSEFANLSLLPTGWIRIRSSSNGKIYFMNTETGETKFTEPEAELPAGWTAIVSKSTGKKYYWNSTLNKSQFVVPT